ncbi:MAG: RNA pseudouridine synthase, partial [Tenuifilaceae bacterium]
GNKILRGTLHSHYKQFVENCFEICPRHALHAKTLGFTHPLSGMEMNFESPLPNDMAQLVDRWRSYTAGRRMA